MAQINKKSQLLYNQHLYLLKFVVDQNKQTTIMAFHKTNILTWQTGSEETLMTHVLYSYTSTDLSYVPSIHSISQMII